MIIDNTNTSQIILEIILENFDGSLKNNITSAKTRVYYILSTTEVNILSSIDLVNISTGKYRYIWNPDNISTGSYIIEYTIVDEDSISAIFLEDLIINDISDISTIKNNVDIIRKIETGRWKIDTNNNTMIFYNDDGTTPFLTFDLKNANGVSSNIDVFERVPQE